MENETTKADDLEFKGTLDCISSCSGTNLVLLNEMKTVDIHLNKQFSTKKPMNLNSAITVLNLEVIRHLFISSYLQFPAADTIKAFIFYWLIG